MSNGYDSDEAVAPLELEPWVRIQSHTFANWVNDKLRVLDLEVEDPAQDFRNGILLCRLMEVLQGGRIGRVINKKNVNHYEASGNLALAMEAMKKDGVRLVNIGAEDIAGGNTKLILGMIWTLIRRYQIGSQSRLPPKKLMLSWANAVLYPHRHLTNFGSDWTDGVALHGIVEYCHPGFCPSWHSLSSSDSLNNCRNAMQGAEELLGVPPVVSPENFSSPDLDELSGMTYLSYFTAEGAPGYNTTLQWVNSHVQVSNFDKDWNNGYILSELVCSLGGNVPGWPDPDSSDWPSTIQAGES
ncbi:hypothetical protein CAPTEDRAFT_118724 [Capitella teleta]|uniref:Calponin-homology (CH) domain-containing protein n=1 Tax=Capitella teleta TaxID=283909 RepID=R7T5Q2_CAPTE|nr:hypothetical protein CAPTEDRAFT_118724 [Capitella teleta]|eukprot:ELT88714.1 hypothetical protein CAPTEDRAFT_118724 [Capitella teleta]